MTSEIIFASLQTVATTVLVSIVGYRIQRNFQIKDDFTKEKNKTIASKSVECETEIFEIFKSVGAKYTIPPDEILNYSNRINELRFKSYLYIDEAIYKVSEEFADYLLEIHEDSNCRDKYKEEEFFKKFKNKFKR
jgi:hypothetical protein